MSHPGQACCRLAMIFAIGQIAVFQLAAGTATNAPAPHKILSAPTQLLPPPVPLVKSPVDLFRELLAMAPAERGNFLSNRPPAIRDRILAKLREYEALDPNDRELRLRATELRWYLLPLMHESPANRAVQLAAMPEDMRTLVKTRLMRWDVLPPPLQKEFLNNERTLRYFTQVNSPNGPPMPPDPNLAHWNSLTEEQRQKIIDQCNQFFDLTPREKQKALNTLSDAERQQMEKTLDAFGKLPPLQRFKCIHAFTEFAGMSAQEKQDFLKNAQRWSQMSPKERQTWRDLVTHVPEWAPLPPPAMPPLPAPLKPRSHPLAVTNPV